MTFTLNPYRLQYTYWQVTLYSGFLVNKRKGFAVKCHMQLTVKRDKK